MNPADIEMVYVEGGTFMMGSYNGQNDKKPVHKVTVKSFYIGKYEVTQKQWKKVMGTNPSHFKGCYNCPVENVSWNDVQEFLRKLNTKTGQHYRLPTEAEWEYAAQGGNKSKGYKYSGSNNISEVAWYWGNSGKTHAVGMKHSNELGIYDMSGNVWEWCSDWYNKKYYKKSPQDNPQGLSGGKYRILRGGGWYYSESYCHTTHRNWSKPGNRNDNYGFRIVRDPVK